MKNKDIKKGRHCREGRPQGSAIFHACCNKTAFTLLEMLLVVLIVGILTAVALPMYQRAVYKSRFSKLMLPAKSLASANEAFFLANGEYSELPAQLDVGSDTATLPDGSNILLSTDDTVSFVRLSNAEVPNARYVVYQQRSANFAGTTMCESLDSDDRATWLCSKGLNGTKVDSGNSGAEAGWSAYVLTGAAGQNDQFAAIGGNNNDPGDEPTDPTEPQEPEPQTPPAPQCDENDKPEDISVPAYNKSATAICVNGQWKYVWTGGAVYSTNYDSYTTACQANSGENYKCAGSTFDGKSAKCVGYATNGCADSVFGGLDNICVAYAANSCANSIFNGEVASCAGRSANGCAGSVFNGDSARCYGYAAKGCAGTIIQAGGYCLAYTNGGCDDVLYGAHPGKDPNLIGACHDRDGRCPNGVPITNGVWDGANKTMNITGWKGGYCDPNAMASGKCPAGTHSADANGTLDGQCWDGNGNRVACE